MAHAQEIGFDAVVERGRLAAANLPDGLVLAGFSLGVLPAQMLAQNHPGALGALLYHGCVSTSEFGGGWPDGVPVQVHAMDGDPFFAEDVDAARALVATAKDAELFLHLGDRHLFTDNTLPEYDESATALVLERTLALLSAVDAERGDRS
ncbi:MAG: dienelactone hydrolase family protein [Umezawaea sp.]